MLGYNPIAETPYSAVFEYPLNEARVSLPGMVGGVGTVSPTLGAGVDGQQGDGLVGIVSIIVDVDNSVTAVSAIGEIGDVRASAVNRVFPTGVVGTLGDPDTEAVIGVTATPVAFTATASVGIVAVWTSFDQNVNTEVWEEVPTS